MHYFRTHTEINLGAIRRNAAAIKAYTGKRLIAVIKADAYGHGMIPVAETLSAVADMFAVATTEEGMRLRQAGIHKPILILFSSLTEDAPEIVEHELTPTVADWEFADPIKQNRFQNLKDSRQYQYRHEPERRALDGSGAVPEQTQNAGAT